MKNILTSDDFHSIRGFLRWAGIGVIPSAERASAVQSVVTCYAKTEFNEALKPAKDVAESVSCGLMVSQDACKAAEQKLVYAYQAQADNEVDSRMDSERA